MMIECLCGCGTSFPEKDNRGRPRKYVSGHNIKIKNPEKQETIACGWCGQTFIAYKTKHSKFCSRTCKSKYIGKQLSEDVSHSEKMREISLANGTRPPIMKGANHPNWKGGITPKNQADRASKKYQDWRLAVYRKDFFTCQKCGQVGKDLHAHHILSWAKYPESRYEINNGITFCADCHYDHHGFTRKTTSS